MEIESTNHPGLGVQSRSNGSQAHADRAEYVEMRVDGTALVLNLTEHERLSPERSLELVRHSSTGFEWGYTGSGPAQLARAIFLDYYGDETVAQQHYIQFRNEVVSQLSCDEPADCWHLTGEDIEAVFTSVQDNHVLTPDGGEPSPPLPSNWSAVSPGVDRDGPGGP